VLFRKRTFLKAIINNLLVGMEMAKRGRKPVKLTRCVDFNALETEMKRATRKKEIRYVERLRAIHWIAEGRSRAEVEDLLHRSAVTIRNWISAWNEGGFTALHPHFEHGRPAKLSSKQIEQLKGDLCCDPNVFGYNYSVWTVKLIRNHLYKKFKISYHLTALYRTLRSWNIIPERYHLVTRDK
jgi:transposase